jgi:hypothetical protein
MNSEDYLLFTALDPGGRYTSEQICWLLKMAKDQGHSLERGTYLEQMTISQLDALVHGKTDA